MKIFIEDVPHLSDVGAHRQAGQGFESIGGRGAMGWSGWKAAGGVTYQPPTVAAGEYSLEIYVMGTDNCVHRNGWGDGWEGWHRDPSGRTWSSPPAAVGIGGETRLFAVSNQRIEHCRAWTQSDWHVEWGAWEVYDETGRTPVRPGVTAYSATGPFYPHLLVRGTDNQIHHHPYTTSWKLLGGATFEPPAIVYREASAPIIWLPGGKPDLVAAVVGTDARIHWNVFDGDNWDGWRPMPSGETPSSPALADYDGETWMVVRGTDDGIHYCVFDGTRWGSWIAVPGGGRTASAPAAVAYDDDLYVVVRGTDNQIYMNCLS